MASLRGHLLRLAMRHLVSFNKPVDRLREDLRRLPGKKLPRGMERTCVSGGGVPCEWYVPAGAPPDRAVIYLHGGGYALGLVAANRSFVAELAHQAGLRVLLVDYRLAPEHRFPAALDDALSVYRWLLGQGVAAGHVALAGDSSGCGLALAALQELRATGDSLPAGLACMCPVVDLVKTGDSMRTRAKADPLKLQPEYAPERHYVADHDAGDPRISPLFGDMQGLPPLLLHAADCDVFLSDAERLAEKARLAGVTVDLEVWPGLWHNFQMSASLLPEGRAAVGSVGRFLRDRLQQALPEPALERA